MFKFLDLRNEKELSYKSTMSQKLEEQLEITHEEYVDSQEHIESIERAKNKQSSWFINKTQNLMNDIQPSRVFAMINASPDKIKIYLKMNRECPNALKVLKVFMDHSYVNQSNLTYDKLEEITHLSRATIAKCLKYLYENKIICFVPAKSLDNDGSVIVDHNTYFINPDFFWNSDRNNIYAIPEKVLYFFGITGIENLKRKFNHYVSIDNHKIVKDFFLNIANTSVKRFNFVFIISLLMNKWGSILKSQKELAEIFGCSIRAIQSLIKFCKEKGLIKVSRNDKFAFGLLKQNKIGRVNSHNRYDINSTLFWKTNTRTSFMYNEDVSGVVAQRQKYSDIYFERKRQAA